MTTPTPTRINPFNSIASALLAASLFLAPSAYADESVQTLSSIQHAVRVFLEQWIPDADTDTSVRIGKLDPRLRLARCGEPLEVQFPSSSGWGRNMTLGVRCAAPKPWTIYVTARAIMRSPVLVASRSLARGTVIGPGDVELRVMDTGLSPYGYFTEAAPVLAQKLKRPVAAGKPIVGTMLEQQAIVERGERVSIVARSAGLSVRMTGKALEAGGLGESVRVRNLSSKKTVEGKVAGPGLVQVAL
jgi:flagella basal body P-ring formation protein FlgA